MAYSSSGRLAFAAVTALWVWAASTAFVSSNSGVKGLRGVERNTHAEYVPFPAAQEMGEPGARSMSSGMQAVMLAAVVGLMVGLAPVRAEEAVETPAPAEAAPAVADVTNQLGAPIATASKAKTRKSLQKVKAAASASYKEDEGTGKKKRVIISPADELDEDELSPFRPNQPLLFLIFATPVTIYLTFYVLGSLNII